MIYGQYAHVRASANAALFDDFGRLIDDIHEADGPRGNAPSRIDHRAGRAQKFVRHSGAAARLVNDGDVLRVFHYALDRVWNIQHKACSKLAFWFAGIDQAW